ncbi:unnamed protein product [Adineta steineri]|uniref:SH3 domain-containing protein n=1 Tax=Adineta steineri TaxID=433720 RepID=A0A814KPY8_9BILA|nr:unnamed protein product [Adineta steineri]CAF1344488.1 unnamed protein product [Adineta steineri]
MEQSRKFTKLLRILQFRKHVKELTSACKRINKEKYHDFHTVKQETIPTEKKFNKYLSKKERNKSLSHLSIQKECMLIDDDDNEQPLENMNSCKHLSRATPSSPANLSMIISQSYKPLHAKSMQYNKNTIAVTKDTTVKALYKISNWVFIEIPETGETGFIPIYCLQLSESSFESPSQNNISLFNVSIYDKPRYSRVSITNKSSDNISTPPPPGRFISSIGPCQMNNELQISTCPRLNKTRTYTRQQFQDESVLSRQISNVSLHPYDQNAYETLNLTSCKSSSVNVLDKQPLICRSNPRLRVIENYQRQFVGDISVLESEVVTPVDTIESIGDWMLIRRGDGKQGYIPEHIVTLDENLT